MHIFSMQRLVRFLIYLLTFIILWTSLQPVFVLTILNSTRLWFLFILAMVLMFYFKCPRWVSASTCGIMILFQLHFYFYRNEQLFSLHWMRPLYAELIRNFGHVWQGQFYLLSDPFTAFLFFILFGFILFGIRHWLANGHVGLLITLAILSLALIDTFTSFNADRSMIMVTIASLLLVILNKWTLFTYSTSKPQTIKQTISWFTSGLVLGVVLLLFALLVPKPTVHWNTPSNYLSSLSFPFVQKGSFFSDNQRIGYDQDDSRLGGSLNMDTTPLFTANISGNPGYWRVAYKDYYTGHGWDDSNHFYLPINENQSLSSLVGLYGKQTRTNRETATIHFSKESPAILPYTGQPVQVRVPGRHLNYEQTTGQVLTTNEQWVSSEQLVYDEPIYQMQRLRQSTATTDPEVIRKRYLQLPDSLPSRVINLGQSLTAGKSNRYDQVKAVVDYLRSSRFTYSTEHVPRPAKGQDYVDQFLFDSKVGYCDNFSTSMVILLRASGIPARWVKGFTTGEYQGQVKDKVKGKQVYLNKYQITNEDAHSWGEVYFPGSGWISFEPTPSFNNPNQFASSSSTDKTKASQSGKSVHGSESKQGQSSGTSASTDRRQQQAQKHTNESQQQRSDQKNKASQEHISKGHVNGLPMAWIVFALIITCTFVAVCTRKRWLTKIKLKKIQHINVHNEQDFQRAYLGLLSLMALHGLKRKDTETLREFANRVDEKLSDTKMQKLTDAYEQLLYEKHTQGSLIDHQSLHRLIQDLGSHFEK
ncbi:DUF4129 domain-containing transglutaminase family protein [Sporolactobacillus kofuensis]|uniref:DUF4129 domain-containing transglutaminase family protein n=1 Tax=Sporolactobacillus kofuensis TaxID=269672 RepID=A0ABW1WIG5_9BACL|nr:transglutaminaseTgpA domain-containing protein [Sporolactobacillus kofuensis]MCO7176870.1 transglutaminaseTgpA domain-containing protein [Sporolactobacillus kofuensis]